jgi:hypothetical protein
MTMAKLLASSSVGLIALAFACAASAQSVKRPDLNGTYDNAGDLATAASAVIAKPGQSLCVFACPPAANAPPVPAGSREVSRGFVLPPVERPKYKPEFLAKVKDLDNRQVDEDTSLRCASPGLPRIGPPEKIVQTDREVIFLYEDIAGPFFRVIPTDGRARLSNLDRSPLGDALGRWEGDTLVVETVNFTDDTWLTDDGAFHTKNLRVVERVRRVAGGGIEWQATSHDPEVLAEPWTRTRTLAPAKNEIVVSAQCREQSLAQMQDKTHHDNVR